MITTVLVLVQIFIVLLDGDIITHYYILINLLRSSVRMTLITTATDSNFETYLSKRTALINWRILAINEAFGEQTGQRIKVENLLIKSYLNKNTGTKKQKVYKNVGIT